VSTLRRLRVRILSDRKLRSDLIEKLFFREPVQIVNCTVVSEYLHLGVGENDSQEIVVILFPCVRETLLLQLRARTTRTEAITEARRLLRVLGLEARAHEPAARLTLIDRKRLELARALATSPRLLLLDEFMAGLNPTETATAMELVRDLVAAGVSVLMVEHIVWALMDLAGRIVVLSAGEKIADGPPAAVAADPNVVDVYLGGDVGGLARA